MKLSNIIGKIKNSSKKVKTIVISFGVASLIAVPAMTIPLIMMNNKNSENFKEVLFNGQKFSSKTQLLDYIREDSDEIEKDAGQKIYTVSIGNDTQDYETYADAYDYVLNKLNSLTIYKKPNVTEDKDLHTISPENFIKTKDAIKYVTFAKYDSSVEFNKSGKHSYTFAPDISESDSEDTKTGKQIKINEARDEAAMSYIQMHTAYKFNNVYFNSLNDVKTYIITNWSDRAHFDEDKLPTSTYKELVLENNRTIKIGDASSVGELASNENFRRMVIQNSTPYFKFGDKPNEFVKVSMENVDNIKNHLNESNLDYIEINSNDDEVTQIVDMDGTTKNGNLYGQYYVRSGQGMDGVDDVSNWEQVSSDTNLHNSMELVDVSMLKSIINYVIKTKGFSSFMDFLYVTKISKNGVTFANYLKDNFSEDYVQDSLDLLGELSKGIRNNHLDNIIALHSFLINKMIQKREDSKKIVEVARYFDSIMKMFDSVLAGFLAPYLTADESGDTISSTDYQINYFQSAFHFYDDTEAGKGISFQNNPYSYYRKLTGHSTGDDEEAGTRKSIFLLSEAVMGIHAISMNALRHNQTLFSNWASKYQNQLEINKQMMMFSGTRQSSLKFVNHNDKNNLWDFSFSDNTNPTKDEVNSIWNNVSKIDQPIKIGDKYINQSAIRNNMNNYLQNIQNAYISDYKTKLLNSEKSLRDYFEKTNKKKNEKGEMVIIPPTVYDREAHKDLFKVNTIEFISIKKGDIFDNHQTTSAKFDHLASMVENAIKPLEDRIINFGVKLGTLAVQTAIAVCTAGAGAEASMIEEETVSLESSSMSSWGAKMNDSYMGVSRSETYNETFKITRETKQSVEGDNLWDKLNGGVSWDKDDTDGEKENFENSIADVYGFLYSFGNKDIQRVVSDIFKIGIGIVKNVIPFVSTLFNIVDSFSSSDHQVYSFSHAEKGTELYWNGGLVKYSWWGLDSDQVYSIKDLKMIKPQEIISGYPQLKYYYGNTMNGSLDSLKIAQAEELVKNTLRGDRSKIGVDGTFDKNIYWRVNIKNLVDSEKEKPTQSLNELVDFAAKKGVADIAKNVYKTADGYESSDLTKVEEKVIDATLNNLKNILILKLPEYHDNKIVVDKEFALPFPYWNSGSLKKSTNNTHPENINKNYIIFNPNINLGALSTLGGGAASKTKIMDAMNAMNNQDYESSKTNLNALVKPYIDNIYVPQKDIIFQELNDRNKISFEDLDNAWTEHSYTIYSFSTDVGEDKYYTNRRVAIKELLSGSNYALTENVLGRVTKIYRFNNSIFNSINDIYNYIMDQQKDGSNYEEKN